MKTLTALAFLAATPALADCPTADDLDYGIRMTESDGTENIFRAIGGGFVENVIVLPDGVTFTNTLAHGTYVTRSADLVDNAVDPETVIVTRYAGAEILPRPMPNTNFEFATKVNNFGEAPFPEQQTHAWGPLTSVTIGTCTYQAMNSVSQYISEGDVLTETMQFIPALNLALLLNHRWEGDELVEYIPVSIETVQ